MTAFVPISRIAERDGVCSNKPMWYPLFFMGVGGWRVLPLVPQGMHYLSNGQNGVAIVNYSERYKEKLFAAKAIFPGGIAAGARQGGTHGKCN